MLENLRVMVAGVVSAICQLGCIGGTFLAFFGALFLIPKMFELNWKQEEEKKKQALLQAEHERKLRTNADFWHTLSPLALEQQVGQLFAGLGYEVAVTRASGDGGVDVFLKKNETLIVVQCKKTSAPISPSAARDLYGTMLHFRATGAILVSTNGFSSKTVEFCEDKPIELLDAYGLARTQIRGRITHR